MCCGTSKLGKVTTNPSGSTQRIHRHSIIKYPNYRDLRSQIASRLSRAWNYSMHYHLQEVSKVDSYLLIPAYTDGVVID